MPSADPLPPHAWAQILDAAADHKKAGGDLNTVRPGARDARGRPLGAWLVRACRAVADGTLPPAVAARLRDLGLTCEDRSARATRSAHSAAAARVAGYARTHGLRDLGRDEVAADGYAVGAALDALRALARRGDLPAADWDTLRSAGLRLPGRHPDAPPSRRGRPPGARTGTQAGAPPPGPAPAVPSKYARLHALLRGAAPKPTVALPMADVAALVGGLPETAYRFDAWWTTPSVRSAAWTEAGYRAVPNLTTRTVRFTRARTGTKRT